MRISGLRFMWLKLFQGLFKETRIFNSSWKIERTTQPAIRCPKLPRRSGVFIVNFVQVNDGWVVILHNPPLPKLRVSVCNIRKTSSIVCSTCFQQSQQSIDYETVYLNFCETTWETTGKRSSNGKMLFNWRTEKSLRTKKNHLNL